MKKMEMELYLEPKLVKEATKVLEDLGLDLETGIRIFLTKIAYEFEWPYEFKREDNLKISEDTEYYGNPTKILLDKYTYEESSNFFKYEDLDNSNVINDFLKKVCEYRGIPFNIKKREFNKETLEALKEAEDIASGKIQKKGYHNVRQMFEDILNEED